MKVTMLLMCILSIYCLNLKGQDSTQFEDRIAKLENEFKEVQDRQRSSDQLIYNNIRTNLTIAVELQSQIEEVYTYIKGDVATADVYNKLARVNSPVSDVLGFKFSKIIADKAKLILDSPEYKSMPHQKKSKFLEIVNKIVNNPIASAIQSTFPITGTIRSVITAASTFFSEPNVELDLDKQGGKITNVRVKEVKGDSGLSNEFIEKYLLDLSPYLIFYEKLEYSNLQYEISNAELLKNYQNLPVLIKSFKNELNAKLSLSDDMTLVQKFSKIDEVIEFNQSPGNNFPYKNIITRPSILEANNIAKQIGMAVIELENFYGEFVQNVSEKLTSDSEILDDAKKLGGAKEDKINEIKQTIQSYLISGTISRYNNNLARIKTLKNKIVY